MVVQRPLNSTGPSPSCPRPVFQHLGSLSVNDITMTLFPKPGIWKESKPSLSFFFTFHQLSVLLMLHLSHFSTPSSWGHLCSRHLPSQPPLILSFPHFPYRIAPQLAPLECTRRPFSWASEHSVLSAQNTFPSPLDTVYNRLATTLSGKLSLSPKLDQVPRATKV